MTATPSQDTPEADARPLDFVRQIVADDLAGGRHTSIVTRFPPEPNGYLHIGHAKAICIDFGIPQEATRGDFRHSSAEGATPASVPARCHLRFDDTNPTKEEQRYIDAIKEDVRWLGFDWGEHEYYASDYYQQLYDWAVLLVKAGKAYVCDLSGEDVRRTRGTLTEAGAASPYRDRSVEQNLDLLARMMGGEFADGSRTLRAKIDMASPNFNLRDPVMYRILHARHHRTGDDWCIYPMYDWAHGQSDWIEGITHSICTLEFEDHRPLYDWFVDALASAGVAPAKAAGGRPRQIEFARLSLTYTMMSKRRLLELVTDGHVNGWDDPRMPTLCGLRRRGYTAEAIRDFCGRIGVTKYNSVTDVALLDNCVREDLNRTASRVMAVLNPLKVVITNYPDGHSDTLDAVNNPEDPAAGTRQVPFSKVLYIERDDFRQDPPPKFYRLAPGREVRLRYAYFITCQEAVTDAAGDVVELHCTYDPATRGGDAPDGRKVKATLHWVSADHALDAELRLYDHLFKVENPADVEPGADWRDNLNSESVVVNTAAKIEPTVVGAAPGTRYQFERTGYFCVDPDTTADRLVFNRTVTLKDTWAKIQKKKK